MCSTSAFHASASPALARVASTSQSPYWKDELDRVGLLPMLRLVERGPQEPATVRAMRRGISLPQAFDAWFATATASSVADRFPDAVTQIVALARVLDVDLPRTAMPTSPPASSAPSAQMGQRPVPHEGQGTRPHTIRIHGPTLRLPDAEQSRPVEQGATNDGNTLASSEVAIEKPLGSRRGVLFSLAAIATLSAAVAFALLTRTRTHEPSPAPGLSAVPSADSPIASSSATPPPADMQAPQVTAEVVPPVTQPFPPPGTTSAQKGSSIITPRPKKTCRKGMFEVPCPRMK